MADKITWDETGSRTYETGVKHGVLYLLDTKKTDAEGQPNPNFGKYVNGVAWNGLSSITESPSGAEANAIYADDMKYLNLFSAEEFGATIEAYTYPKEFEQCDGSADIAAGISVGQQYRNTFGLCYRTILGNDVQNDQYGYKLHFIYGAMASPSEKNFQTVNDSPEAISFSWEITTTPVSITKAEGFKSTATMVIDSTKINADSLAAIEAILYEEKRLPLPDEIIELVNAQG